MNSFIKSINEPISSLYNKKCEECNYACNAIHFQRNFENWTSGDNDIDKFIQDTQLSAHYDLREALEWIPYDRFNDVKYVSERRIYKANWIDGHIRYWNDKNQNWKRDHNMFAILKSLNNLKNIALEFTNEINRPCGITQDPETKNYMMVLNNICKKCKHVCNAIYFQQNFENWTSNDDDIDKFIRDTQLLVHDKYNIKNALEWIPHDKLNDIKYVTKNEFGEVYRANWIDGNISYWDYKNQNWKREGTNNMFVNLMNLSTPKHITIEFTNEIKSEYEFYGITQDPITKNYMMVLNNICKKCKIICYTMYFQHKFIEWTSGNNDIDKFIQNTQLSAHEDTKEALEWIPYDRFDDVKYVSERRIYKANWIDGHIRYWDDKNQNWKREHNMFAILKSLNNLKNIALEFTNETLWNNSGSRNKKLYDGFK
ncbi:hypothetical protein RclHR1_28610001 [Rhizophagus clarus]|uniref:Uncharacterized protein n=1 Tax=Rhizophagus clarus TaxID=94130 RepID=A0A2Z6R4C8_9GLOM|nr:hypothetical protein RclHR1_28610001 [Rhizophagus clarus]